MEITIIGAGAIGGTIGAHMIRAGHDVTLCDLDQTHVDAINKNGLRIEGPVENFTVSAKAITPDQLPSKIEHVGVAVKSHHTAAAAELLRGRITPNGYVVTFQNGLTAHEIAAVVGEEKLIVSFVNFGADYLEPGRIMQGNIGTFRVGELFTHEITPRVTELVAALPYAQATHNILGFLWGKEAYGAMLYAGAVSDLSIADVLESQEFKPLMLAIAREVLAQSPVKPEGFDGFDPDDLEGSLVRLVAFNRASAKTHSGIYRDLAIRKRKTEVDDLMRDLKGPLTNHVGRLIHSIERGERICEIENLRLLATYEKAHRLGMPLNAIVNLIEAPIRKGSGPLHGVQIAVKDIIDIAGQPRGNGNPTDMQSKPAEFDAPLISQLRALGADIFATSTLLEYAAGATHPNVAEAMNPFNVLRTAGGSSGGSASLVGAGVCEVAIGTDTGGSIRIPAHYCNCVGFKPSYGSISLERVTALSPTYDHVGLLAKDVAWTVRVFQGLTNDLTPINPREIRGMRIGILPSDFKHPALTQEVAFAVRQSINDLVSCGAIIVEIDDSLVHELDSIFEDSLLFEIWQTHGEQVSHKPQHYGPETLRLLQASKSISQEQYENAMGRRRQLLLRVPEMYSQCDVLLRPSTPYVAPATTPPIDTPEGAAEGVYTAVFNITGDPAISLPCAFSPDGMPIGLQLATLKGSDIVLLEIAIAIEKIIAP